MKSLGLRKLAAWVFLGLIISGLSLQGEELKPGEIVSKHLNSIGSEKARKDVTSRVVQGATTYRLIVGGSGATDGKFVFATDGQKSNFLVKVNASGYFGEQFVCDGKKTSVAATYADKHRSEFGNFILVQDSVLRENLLGGVWSSGWALMDVEGRGTKLHSEGMKKVDGRDLIALRFLPKKNTDLDIVFYFDPQTYQHVMTIYRMTKGVGINQEGEDTSQMPDARYLMEERFSDFRSADGLTLPHHYDLRYTVEMARGLTKSVEWEVAAPEIMNNQSVDPRSFQVK